MIQISYHRDFANIGGIRLHSDAKATARMYPREVGRLIYRGSAQYRGKGWQWRPRSSFCGRSKGQSGQALVVVLGAVAVETQIQLCLAGSGVDCNGNDPIQCLLCGKWREEKQGREVAIVRGSGDARRWRGKSWTAYIRCFLGWAILSGLHHIPLSPTVGPLPLPNSCIPKHLGGD